MVTQNTRSNEYLRFMFYTGGLSSDCFNKNVNTAMNEYGLSLLNLASIPTILYVDAQVTYLLTYLRVLTANGHSTVWNQISLLLEGRHCCDPHHNDVGEVAELTRQVKLFCTGVNKGSACSAGTVTRSVRCLRQ